MDKERIAKKLIRLAEELVENLEEDSRIWAYDKYYDDDFVVVKELLDNDDGEFGHLIRQFDSKILDKPDDIIFLRNGDVLEVPSYKRSEKPLKIRLAKKIGEIEVTEEDWDRLSELDLIAFRMTLYFTNIDDVFIYEIY